jgi:hypothetical protein
MEILQEELSQMKIKVVGKVSPLTPEEGWAPKRGFLLGNKCDVRGAMDRYNTLKDKYQGEFLILPISAKEGMNVDELKQEIYQLLEIIRVYTKVPGKPPDLTEPVILKKGSTIEDVALSIHKDFVAKLRYARIWGSGKFDGQMVKRDYPVSEGDVIELHL